MGLNIFGSKKKSFPSGASFRITQSGTDKVQDYSGDNRSRILATLQSRGTSDIDEIAQASGMSRGQVEKTLPGLLNSGFAQMAGSYGSSDGDD